MKTILCTAALAFALAPVAVGAAILINGNATFTPPHLADAQSFTVTLTQPGAPSGTYFIAGGNAQCVSQIQILGGQPGAPPYSGYITSYGKFRFYRLGNHPEGCIVTITSSAGGGPVTISF